MISSSTTRMPVPPVRPMPPVTNCVQDLESSLKLIKLFYMVTAGVEALIFI